MQVLFFYLFVLSFWGFFTVCLKVKGRKVESEQQKWHSAERQSYLRAAGIFFLHSLSPFGAVLLLRRFPKSHLFFFVWYFHSRLSLDHSQIFINRKERKESVIVSFFISMSIICELQLLKGIVRKDALK